MTSGDKECACAELKQAQIRGLESRMLLQRVVKRILGSDAGQLELIARQVTDYLQHTHDPKSILQSTSDNEGEIELKITAAVSNSKMYLRTYGATADLPDGRQLAVEPVITGAGIVITVRNVDKTSRTYYLDAQALGSAVLEHETLLNDERKLLELNAAMNIYTPRPGECICWKCLKGKNVAMMVLCPTCGNKRCPKASDHELACTGSNATGQPGSVYEMDIKDLIARSSLGAPFAEPSEAELDIAMAELRRIEAEGTIEPPVSGKKDP